MRTREASSPQSWGINSVLSVLYARAGIDTTPNINPSSIEPLPGALVQDFKKCGRPGCKCARGELHGPYLVRVWYEGKKRRKAYVSAADAPRVEAGIKLRELEQHVARLHASLARRINPRSRALLLSMVEGLEAEMNALRTRF